MRTSSLFSQLVLCIDLLFHSPKDFLYSFKYSNEKRIVMKPYNPLTKKMGDAIVKEIEKKCPEAKVYFFGSTNLGILGVDDIDLWITAPVSKFGAIRQKLEPLLGKPSKRRVNRLEWERIQDGRHIEVVLVKPTSGVFAMQKKLFVSLRDDKKLLNEYVRIKKSLHAVSARQYHWTRMRFFNKIVAS
jgi:hypothetical protein